MNIYFFPSNKMNPYTGYGKNEYGLMRGLASVANLTPLANVAIVTGNPSNVNSTALLGKKIALYTMSESTKVSQLWVDRINRGVGLVLVPCPDLVTIYKDSGVLVPVVYVGHGVDLAVPVLSEPLSVSDGFRFLTYSLGDMRKGAELAVLAALTEFSDEEKVSITVKVNKVDSWVSGALSPRVRVMSRELGEQEWFNTLSSHHAMVFPSRAEGWGMPPREAVLAGIPAIATKWLGMWDVDNWGVALNVKNLAESTFSDWEANAYDGMWAEPDPVHLRQLMRNMYNDYYTHVSNARLGREYLLNNFSYETVAGNIIKAINDNLNTP